MLLRRPSLTALRRVDLDTLISSCADSETDIDQYKHHARRKFPSELRNIGRIRLI